MCLAAAAALEGAAAEVRHGARDGRVQALVDRSRSGAREPWNAPLGPSWTDKHGIQTRREREGGDWG